MWPPIAGTVRLDGASLSQWDPRALGEHIGYLPQDVSLFGGSIAENIARFDPDASSDKIIAAAKAAGVYDMIVQFPEGLRQRSASRDRHCQADSGNALLGKSALRRPLPNRSR